MTSPTPLPQRLPQRVVVAEASSPAQAAASARLAAALDVPHVLPADRPRPADVEQVAAFDGWVAVLGPAERPAALLERADLLVVLQFDIPGTLRGLVRRTVRRMRADAPPEADLSWIDGLSVTHPDLAVVRLVGADEIERWLSDLERPVSG